MPDEIVRALARDYGVHPYSKWRGAHWRLASLVEIAPDDARAAARRAAEDVLGWLADPRRPRRFPTIEGRVRRCASQEGLALYACCRIGMAEEPRLRTIADSLVATQWPDGGWNCDRRPEATHSSFNETWAPTMGLAAYARDTGGAQARAAAERGAEFLLVHHVFQSHRTGEPAHPAVIKLRFPPYWHYDVLVGLITLARSVGLADARTSDALDLVESRRRDDGTWRADGRWWKPPGSKGSNVEAVDWGETAHERLTARAFEVLGAANRLQVGAP
ncbi:MAG: hypothetical protein E6G64_16325 [Actinobacteria bacterium]|nr:MAG: hypothetical protein E6G64_16325 [Actinomycetota bacterium]